MGIYVGKTIGRGDSTRGAPLMTRAGHTLSILKKHNGKWVLARDANMLSPGSTSGG
jgi:hypothetical protein